MSATFEFAIVSQYPIPKTHMIGTREDGLQMEMNIYQVERIPDHQKRFPIVVTDKQQCINYMNTFFTMRFLSKIVPAQSENEKWGIKLISAEPIMSNFIKITISQTKPQKDMPEATSIIYPAHTQSDKQISEIDDSENTFSNVSYKNKFEKQTN